MSGNSGVAGGTRGADPVPSTTTAPDGSTVLGTEDPVDYEISEAEQQRRWENQPGADTPQNMDYSPDESQG